MFHEAATGVAADEGPVGGSEGGFLKVAQRDTGDVPTVDAQDGGFHVTQKGLVDRHVAGGGGGAIEQQAGGKGHGERLR